MNWSIMADPISALGTAVSVLSFGVQVTQGLVSYCKAYQDHSEDLKEINAQATREEDTLSQLKDALLLLPTGHEKEIDLITRCIDGAGDVFKDLDQKVRKYDKAASKRKTEAKSRDVLQSALYPFRKQKVQKLQDKLDRIGRIRKEALQILHLNLARDVCNTLHSHKDEAIQQGKQISLISKSALKIESRLEAVTMSLISLENAATCLKTQIIPGVDRVESIMECAKSQQQNVEQDVHLSNSDTSKLLMPTQELVPVSKEARGLPYQSQERDTNRQPPALCRCDKTGKRYKRLVSFSSFLRGSFFAEVSTGHEYFCPCYAPSSSIYAVEIRGTCPGSPPRLSVQVSTLLKITSVGISIWPTVNYYPVVSSSFEQFSILEGYDRDGGDFDLWFGEISNHLQYLFRDGKASPFDVDEYGRTLVIVRPSILT